MTRPYDFRGQMPILPTTIHADNSLDLQSQRKLVDYCLANGAAAIGHLGGASEYHKVASSHREAIIATVIEQVNGRVPVFIGTTDLSIVDSLENARIAQKLGADLLMVCSPAAGVMRKDDLFDYYRAVSESCDLPIIVQDTGASAGQYDADFMVKLGKEIPACMYAKAEGADFLDKTRALLDGAGDSMQIVGGAAGFHMIQLLRLGITAFMTGTEACEVHNEVIHSWLGGNEDAAIRSFYTKLLPYLEIFNLDWRFFLKYMLHKRGLIENTKLLFPLDGPAPSPLLMQEMDYILDRIAKDKI